MLNYYIHRKQKGVVLLITLIVLVAMTLAGIALVRSVDTANLIAGNLAFQQSATHAGDTGIESAITWLETNNSGTTLHENITSSGYFAIRQDPVGTQSWDNFWTTSLASFAFPQNPSADEAGNRVQYVIHRLCNNSGSPTASGSGCAESTVVSTAAGGSKNAGTVALQYNDQFYYRITSRIAGPRNTVSYVQAIVAM